MIRLIKKFLSFFRPQRVIPKVIEKCGTHVTRFKKSCPRCQELVRAHGKVW